MNRSDFLLQLKAHGIKNDIPNISEENALFLRKLIREKKRSKILEIGSANGYSTIQFADELELLGNNGQIASIEFSQLAYEDAGENYKTAKVDHIIKHYFGDARDIIPLLDEQFDFIFIDGLKKASLTFLKLALEKILPSGTIVIDDVIKFRHKMENLYSFVENSNLDYEVIQIDEDDGVMKIEF